MSSRKTSDAHDKLSVQRGWNKGGKHTLYNGEEPNFSQDYDTAAGQLSSLINAGDRRYLDLVRNYGAVAARGTEANGFGFVVGEKFSDYVTTKGKRGASFAVLLEPVLGQGVRVWGVYMISADCFQHSMRGGESGLTTDANEGYLLIEDAENKRYSIAVYEPYGIIPQARVYDAVQEGLIQDGEPFAQFYRFNAKYNLKAAQEKARVQATQREAQVLAGQNEVAVELTVLKGGKSAFTANSPAESSGAGSPHPGTSLCDPGLWDQYAGVGVTPESLGLPKRMLAWQPDGSIRPAVEEYNSLTQALSSPQVAQYAYAVLRSVGVAPDGPPPAPMGQGGGLGGPNAGLLADLAALFG